MSMEYSRHDMVFLTADGFKAACENARLLTGKPAPPEVLELMSPDIPAVVTRQREMRENGDILDIGFPLPHRQNGGRLRVVGAVPQHEIARHITPFAAAGQSFAAVSGAADTIIKGLHSIGNLFGVEVGVFGSLAMHALTGMPYFSEGSDYDIFVRATSENADICGFYKALLKLEAEHAVSIDAEIACLENSGAKLKELFSGQKTVLCKGLYDVKLCRVDELPL